MNSLADYLDNLVFHWFSLPVLTVKWWFSRKWDNVLWWVAYKLPRRVAIYATCRVAAHAAERNRDAEVPAMTIIDVLKAWEV